jgi:hypothetical protein
MKMRDILDKLESIRNSELYVNEIDMKKFCSIPKVKEWLDACTEIMKKRIENGEYPIDVINDLARQYSSFFDHSYDTFAFARDALDRRAWELGLRYTCDENDDSVYSDIKRHAGIEKTERKEKVCEQGSTIEKIKKLLDPNVWEQKAIEIESRRIAEDLWSYFQKLVRSINTANIKFRLPGSKDSESMNLEIFKEYLINEKNLDPFFVNFYYDKFTKDNKVLKDELTAPLPQSLPLIRDFIFYIAKEIAVRRGWKKVLKGTYDKNIDDKLAADMKSVTRQTQQTRQTEKSSSSAKSKEDLLDSLREDIKKYISVNEIKKYEPVQIFILIKRRKEIRKEIFDNILGNPKCFTPFNLEFMAEVFKCLGKVIQEELNNKKFNDDKFYKCLYSLKKCIQE